MALKLEIGAGDNPYSLDPEWEHLDALPWPHVEILADARKIPRPDETYNEIYSHWQLEHAHWKALHLYIREWKRILKPGGTITIITTNNAAINRAWADGQISCLEWSYLTFAASRVGDFGDELDEDSQHAIKAPEYHKAGFSCDYLKEIFEAEGMQATIVETQWSCRETDGRLSCPGIILEAVKP